jgi:hypothetical protein
MEANSPETPGGPSEKLFSQAIGKVMRDEYDLR